MQWHALLLQTEQVHQLRRLQVLANPVQVTSVRTQTHCHAVAFQHTTAWLAQEHKRMTVLDWLNFDCDFQ